MAVRVFGYNIYDFVLSDGFWQDAAQGTTNYHINFPGQVATEWVTKSATPTLTGAHKIQFWTYGYNTAGIDSIRVMPDLVVPPVANFTATPTSGYAPLTVKFTDTSTGSPVTWLWSFGDGGTSTDKNPQHTYTNVGSYTVRLTVRNSDGSSTMEKTNFITVEMPAYSATLVGKYNPKDERMDRSAFRVWSQLNNLNSNRITRAFIHCNTDYPEFAIHCDGPVTKPDFGTSGGGLNNALLHYHTGHGEKVWWGLGGSRIILTDDFVYPTDVFGKWNNKNKWVVIDACEVLSDRSWGNALGTSHGVMGFETGKPMDDQLARFFIQNLNNGETVYNSYLIATRSAYRGDRDSEGYPINNDIRAIVIFKNVYQLSHDSLSSISPDAGPLDPVVIKCWHTKTGEVC
jgi:PKD repeat protein